jgi:hypothetical protein
MEFVPGELVTNNCNCGPIFESPPPVLVRHHADDDDDGMGLPRTIERIAAERRKEMTANKQPVRNRQIADKTYAQLWAEGA